MVVLFLVFTVSEKLTHRKRQQKGLEQFNLDLRTDVESESIGARPGGVLVAVRDYNRMAHLDAVLKKTNTRKQDIVVVTTRSISTGAGEYDLNESQLFTHYEQELFSRVVSLDHPTIIKEGMVFALETYCPATDGYSAARIEEEVVVTDKGHTVISLFPAEELPISARY